MRNLYPVQKKNFHDGPPYLGIDHLWWEGGIGRKGGNTRKFSLLGVWWIRVQMVEVGEDMRGGGNYLIQFTVILGNLQKWSLVENFQLHNGVSNENK